MRGSRFVVMLVAVLSFILTLWSGGCGSVPEIASTSPVAATSSAAFDPVCGISLDVAQAKGAGLTSVWKDNTYYFCSSSCKEKFDKAPMMYHARCPVCNATVQKTAALAAEYSGKPYFFDTAEHRAAFLKEPAKYIAELATDVVCGMEVVKAKAQEAGNTADYQGTTYYFCGPGCKDKFLKDPTQFTGERTAICPVCGMTVVRKEAVAAGLTSIYAGNTYYFCASDCKRYFDKDPGKYLK